MKSLLEPTPASEAIVSEQRARFARKALADFAGVRVGSGGDRRCGSGFAPTAQRGSAANIGRAQGPIVLPLISLPGEQSMPAFSPDGSRVAFCWHAPDPKQSGTYEVVVNNLSIQESRLRRQREKDSAALRELQQLRAQKQRALLTQAAKSYIQAVEEGRHDDWEPAPNGFDFSVTEIELRALEIEPDLFADWAAENAENAA